MEVLWYVLPLQLLANSEPTEVRRRQSTSWTLDWATVGRKSCIVYFVSQFYTSVIFNVCSSINCDIFILPPGSTCGVLILFFHPLSRMLSTQQPYEVM